MKKILSVVLVSMLLIVTSCSSPKMRDSKSVLDSPESHIIMGMKLFNEERYAEAKSEFNDAIKIKWDEKEKAGAYAGLGLCYAVDGKKDKAVDNCEKALDLNDKLPLNHTSFGRALYLLNKGKSGDWLEDAVDHFNEAIELSTEQRDNKALAEAYYFKGVAQKGGYDFTGAKISFSKVVELKDHYAKEANKEWEIVQMIERAKPGTRVGKKIAVMDKIGRGEIAVLFVEELKITEVLEQREKKEYNTDFSAPKDPMKYEAEKAAETIKDIESSWAKSWIKQVVKKGVMEVGPNHKFNPDAKITRAEFAQMLLRVLVIISNDESLYTKHFGETNSMFPDVRTDHYAYNAIAVCATRGIMKAEMNGEFGIAKTVSGAEALLTIRALQNSLRLTF